MEGYVFKLWKDSKSKNILVKANNPLEAKKGLLESGIDFDHFIWEDTILYDETLEVATSVDNSVSLDFNNLDSVLQYRLVLLAEMEMYCEALEEDLAEDDEEDLTEEEKEYEARRRRDTKVAIGTMQIAQSYLRELEGCAEGLNAGLLRKYISYSQTLREHNARVADLYLNHYYGEVSEELQDDMSFTLKKANKIRDIEDRLLQELNQEV